MAADCVVCGEPAAVSGACPHCGAACCGDHRPPSAHDCTGTAAGTTGGWRPDLDGASVDPPERSPASLLRPGVGLGVVTLLVVVAAVGAVAYVGPPDDGLDAGAVEAGIETATVSERRAAGVGAVESDPDLAAVARTHSRDMRDRGYVDHVDPDGVGPQDRAEAAGLDCFVGENIYQTPRGALADSERALADQVVREWLDSAGHRETLLSERYDRQGVGVAVGENAVYVTQLFC